MQEIRTAQRTFTVRHGFDPKPIGQTTWLIGGEIRTGKTGLLTSIPRCLILDFEDKVQFVGRQDLNYVSGLTKLEAIRDLVKWLCAQPPGSREFDTVAFDTLDELMYSVIMPEMTSHYKSIGKLKSEWEDITDFASGGGKGSKGWSIVVDEALKLILSLKQAGYGVVLVCHLKERTSTIPDGKGNFVEVTTKKPAIPPSLTEALRRKVIFLGTTMVRIIKGKPPEYLLYTQAGGDSENTGGNITLPAVIPLCEGSGWQAVTEAYNKRVAELRAKSALAQSGAPASAPGGTL